MIEILGTGCYKCKKLYSNVEKVLEDSNIQAELVKVEELDKIIRYGVMMPPILVINGEVKSTGKVLSPEEIKKLLS